MIPAAGGKRFAYFLIDCDCQIKMKKWLSANGRAMDTHRALYVGE